MKAKHFRKANVPHIHMSHQNLEGLEVTKPPHLQWVEWSHVVLRCMPASQHYMTIVPHHPSPVFIQSAEISPHISSHCESPT